MHHLSFCPRRGNLISQVIKRCQDLVRFFALLRNKPHAPPLVRAPVKSFEFQPCGRTPQVVSGQTAVDKTEEGGDDVKS